MKTVLIGAGGHATVAIDIFRQLYSEEDIVGIIDDSGSVHDVLGIPVIGTQDCLSEIRQHIDNAFIAIGNNQIRSSFAELLSQHRFQSPTLVHPTAIVADSASVHSGTLVAAGAIIQPRATIYHHSIINTGATIDHDCVIHSFAHVCPGVHLAGNVIVGVGAQVGIGSSIIQGCHIGDWSFIGAGSTVVCDIGSFYKAYGCPCKEVSKLA